MVRRLQSVCESSTFCRQAAKLWTQDEHDDFVQFVAENPQAGDLIEGTGGARKLRWARSGTGKRGGVRVITYFHDENLPVFLFMMFAKNERSNLGAGDKRELANVIAQIKLENRTRKSS